jgi:hypothetical protein
MAGADNIYVGSGTVWVAPVGTAFPLVSDVPAAAWFRIGTDGDKSYSEDGITVRRTVSVTEIGALGTTLKRKAVISEAGWDVEFSVQDMAPAHVLLALGGLETDVTTVAAASSIPGTDTIVVPTSPVPIRKAVMVRINGSPAGPEFVTQFEIQDAMQAGGGEATLSKNGAMMFQHLWKALEPASGDPVRIVYQTAAPLA